VTLLEFVTLALAGGVGAGLRFLLDRAVMNGRKGGFPLGILIVNITGSLALGLLVGVGSPTIPGSLMAILGTGLLGGYTTFSTVSVETVLIAERGRRGLAAANLIGTLGLALAAAMLGVLAGGALSRFFAA
jgi:CrcB protein